MYMLQLLLLLFSGRVLLSGYLQIFLAGWCERGTRSKFQIPFLLIYPVDNQSVELDEDVLAGIRLLH